MSARDAGRALERGASRHQTVLNSVPVLTRPRDAGGHPRGALGPNFDGASFSIFNEEKGRRRRPAEVVVHVDASDWMLDVSHRRRRARRTWTPRREERASSRSHPPGRASCFTERRGRRGPRRDYYHITS